MQSSHPRVFLDICKQQWYDATKALSLLVVVKKLAMKYGNILSTTAFMETVYSVEKDVGTMLGITHAMGYTTAEKIKSLMTKIQVLCKDLICTVESSKDLWTDILEATLGNYEQHPSILVDKKLSKPWLHITTGSHRYHRDIDSDLDALLHH